MTKPTHGLSPALIVLMSVATGLAVASNYYAQPLLDTIAHHFSLSASSAGFIVTAAQLGYAAGLLFLVPLGDMFERRTLIVSMTLLAAGGMLITASSQSLSMMILGTALTGLFSVVAQILVPLAATLATPDTRGKVVGTIMSGLLLGILLARTVAGLLANLGGWRTVFWVASALMALMAVALWRGLPKLKSDTHLNYPQLLGSVFSLFIHDKLLRTRALLGCLTFANFSILWTSMAFLLAAPPFSYSEGMIGLFGSPGPPARWARVRLADLLIKVNLTSPPRSAYCCCYSPGWLSGLDTPRYWRSLLVFWYWISRFRAYISPIKRSSIVCIRMRVIGSPPAI